MELPLEVSFHNVDKSDAIEALVRERAEKLEKYFGHLTSCRVAIEAPHKHHRHGNHYHVRILLGLPRGKLVISRDPGDDNAHEDIRIAVRDAFNAAERRLKDYSQKLRGEVKAHDEPLQGQIVMLLPHLDCGFIATTDGREMYFHRNAVIDADYDELEVGHAVELVVFTGDGAMGPHASTVKLIGRLQFNPAPS